jgi:glycosyltransferase involved in cell wall biosynthesis
MLAALPEILRRHPQTRLTIIGDGPDAARLHTRVAVLGLGTAVRFCGPRPHAALPALLVDAALGLALAERTAFRRYACPLKLLEYAAAGVPAVTTVGTEAGDLVRRHGCGVAVPSTPAALAAAVVRLFDQRAELEVLRQGGIAFAAAHTWDRMLAREAELIRAGRDARAPRRTRTLHALESRA